MDDPLEPVRRFACVMRTALAPGLMKDAQGQPIATGACLHASVLLATGINRFKIARASVRGGDGEGDGGAKDSAGRWRGHYWVALELPGLFAVADITGDQFGLPPVRVLAHPEAAEWFRDGHQPDVDETALELAKEFGCESFLQPG